MHVNHPMRLTPLVLGICLAVHGCSTAAPRSDADGGPACDCDDGVFCNGQELCAPEDLAADERGCVAGTPPCGDGACNDEEERCVSDCPDADGDGESDSACGGTDCDDGDATRGSLLVEVCDSEATRAHDEDCNADTPGVDADGDGEYDERCSNPEYPNSVGRDCDDTTTAVKPGVPDGCGGRNEDCDEFVDEDVPETSLWWFDGDGDGFGAGDPIRACAPPSLSYVNRDGDCVDDPAENPDARLINPDRDEICNLVDDDCRGGVDDGLTCNCPVEGASEPCGTSVGNCTEGTRRCVSGQWTMCTGVGPSIERCGGGDENCDGRGDEDAVDATTYYYDGDEDGFGDSGRSRDLCSPSGDYTATTGGDCDDEDGFLNPNTVWYRDYDNDGYATDSQTVQRVECERTPGYTRMRGDCNDGAGSVHPNASDPVGSGIDEDCDGTERCYIDEDEDDYRIDLWVETSDVRCTDDGHALANAPLEWSGSTTRRCCDRDANVNRGNSGVWSSSPVRSIAGCNNFDWDCDGSTEYRYARRLHSCNWSPGSCTGSSGWEGSIPNCGVPGQRRPSCAYRATWCGDLTPTVQQCR